VTCTLCDTVVCGGIKRLKQHLAGGFADTKMCLKTTTEVRKEMRGYLEKNKRKRPLFLHDDEQQGDSDVVVVEQGDSNVIGSSQGSKVPSSGTAAKQRRAAYLYRPPISGKTNATAAPKENKSVLEMLRKTPEEIVDERRKGCSQSTIPANMKSKEEKYYVDMQWALWFYECGVPFNAVAARQFEIAIEATAQYGSGYKPPSPYQFG
jgi:hypothetical protein